MRAYNFYLIGKTGHITGPAQSYELPDDQAAIKQARLIVDGHDVEIWEGARVVAYIVPGQETPHERMRAEKGQRA